MLLCWPSRVLSVVRKPAHWWQSSKDHENGAWLHPSLLSATTRVRRRVASGRKGCARPPTTLCGLVGQQVVFFAYRCCQCRAVLGSADWNPQKTQQRDNNPLAVCFYNRKMMSPSSSLQPSLWQKKREITVQPGDWFFHFFFILKFLTSLLSSIIAVFFLNNEFTSPPALTRAFQIGIWLSEW